MVRPNKLQVATMGLVLLAAPSSALAYIDPGTGSMLVQSVLGIIAAGLVFGRSLWHRVKSIFASRRDADPPRGSNGTR